MTPRAPDPLRDFHPLVRDWFRDALGAPSAPQREGWPAIASGEHTLVLAPTGTGKTLAAFLWELNALIVEGAAAPLPNAVRLLYISPLKALNNDIQRNLERPLAELRARFEHAGQRFPEIRVAVRTGDTPASARARMIRRSPHILITTPESLAIILTSVRARTMFSGLRAVIVDEIHAVAGSKRGAHLALTLERLDEVAQRPAQRIGLSATQRPLEEVARFLGGMSADGTPTPVRIVDCGLVKATDVRVVSPVPDLANVGGTVWPAVAALVLHHIRDARTTLVFVNNRAQSERIAARVNALAGEPIAQPYHGSLARERRVVLESALKRGELRALVSTSSLELGIDIGTVDLVLQLQSPKRVAAALQRVGRAGHSLGVVSRGVLVPTFRDDALEMLAIGGAMTAGEVEPTRAVQNALDVLAQVVVAAASVDDRTADDLFALARRAYPYHALARATFDEVLSMLSGKYASDLAAELEPRLSWDRVTGRVTAPRASRMQAVISGGTIPDRGLYTVNLPDRTRLGELDEEFVHESRVGDAFQLGSTTWRIASIEHDRVIVQPAPGMPARMPFWHGEFMARSFALSARVGALRRELAATTSDGALDALAERQRCDVATVRTLADYMARQRAATGVVPDDRTLVVEQFRDETNAVRVVIHAPFGGRVTAPWGMALAQRAREMLGGPSAGARAGGAVDVQVQTTDDGIMLRLPDLLGAAPVSALLDLSATEAETRVLDEVGTTSLFGARFRMAAARALLLPRGNPRRRMPLWLQRLKALDLLEVVRRHPSFPILVETYREVLQDAFDIAAMRQVLDAIAAGGIEVRTVETEVPSPFSRSLQFGFVMDWMYGDDTPRAERQAALLTLDRGMLADVMGTEASDDGTREMLHRLVAERQGTAPGRRARTADELAHLVDRAGDLDELELRARVAEEHEGRRGDPARELLAAGRLVMLPFPAGDGRDRSPAWRYALTETYARYAAALGEQRLGTVRVGAALSEVAASAAIPEPLRVAVMTAAAARHEIMARFIASRGMATAREISERYGFPAAAVARFLEERERAGALVPGRFREGITDPEWCSRKLAELARRRALAALRRQIEAVELPAFAHFLQRWQHLEPGTRRDGAAGVAAAMAQLHGVPKPGGAWERDYLPARVRGFESGWLSQLAASGTLVWKGEGRRDEASGAIALVQIRFFERGTGSLWVRRDETPALSEPAGRVRDALARDGASFLADIQAATGLGAVAAREALRELVAAGLVTNDTVEAMREVIRARPLLAGTEAASDADPARWLPAGFTPTPGRPVVRRRPNVRRLPKWRRPDRDGGGGAWTGRWALLATPGTLGPNRTEEEAAAAVATQWLERYGIVTRDWWKRERPAVGWRAIYQELKRMEFRGAVRRGYFVRGMAGAQFAVPEAVERLREPPAGDDPFVTLAASDPANPYALDLAGEVRDPLHRPRGPGALLVTRSGRVALAVEGSGRRRIGVAPELDDAATAAAARALATHVMGSPRAARRGRDLLVRTIDGEPAAQSRRAAAFLQAGYRLASDGLVWLEGERG